MPNLLVLGQTVGPRTYDVRTDLPENDAFQ